MKEIFIIIICIALVVAGGSVSQAYLNESSKILVDELEILTEQIKKAQENEKNDSAELAENIYEKWEEIEDKWSIIIMHDELDLIELSLIAMKTGIKEQEYERSIEEVEKSKFLLEHITEKEKFKLKNIF